MQVLVLPADQPPQHPVHRDDQQQCRHEQHHPREAVQKPLPGLVAEVIGDQRQHDHADDVGGEADRDDQDGQGDVAGQAFVADQVEIEQAQGFEREQGLHAGAGVGDQELVLADLQDHAGAADGVVEEVHDRFGHIRDGELHGLGHGVDHRAGQRDHEDHEEQRETQQAHGRGAVQQQGDGGDQPDQGADLEDQDVL